MKKYSVILLSGLIFFGCVPKKKLIREQARVSNLQNDSTNTHSKLNYCNGQYSSLQKDTADLHNSIAQLSASYQATVSNSNMTIADQAKRLKSMENFIQAQKDVMNKLKKTVADALVNFKPDELSVNVKDGKVYVSLQEKLLFQSGSAVVAPEGKQALEKLAVVLINTPHITVDIEGHTDSIPMTGKYEDNWALSTARAISIARVLINNYGVDPHSIVASGRSKYFPIADNTTPEGRAKNRRTEIILSPDLSELFKLLNQ
jgi:chemotaxis protein MotB